jgi:hypothetical protein
MKYIVVCAVAVFPVLTFAAALPLVRLAQFEDNSQLFASLSLWSTIIIAFVTSAMVWIGGRTMRGGVFGRVLVYFSVGMTLIFLGFVTEVPWVASISPLYVKLAHSSLYILGYISMGIAANKLLRTIKG